MEVPVDPEGLLYGGTHRFPRAIPRRYRQVLKGYYIGAAIGPQRLSYGVPIGREESKAIKGKAKRG